MDQISQTEADDPLLRELIIDIEKRMREHRVRSKLFHRITMTMVPAAVFFSLCATIFAMIGSIYHWVVGTLAAAPSALIVIIRQINAEDRSRWHHYKFLKLRCIYDKIKYEGLSVVDASEEMRSLEIEMQDTFPRFSGVGNNISQFHRET